MTHAYICMYVEKVRQSHRIIEPMIRQTKHVKNHDHFQLDRFMRKTDTQTQYQTNET